MTEPQKSSSTLSSFEVVLSEWEKSDTLSTNCNDSKFSPQVFDSCFNNYQKRSSQVMQVWACLKALELYWWKSAVHELSKKTYELKSNLNYEQKILSDNLITFLYQIFSMEKLACIILYLYYPRQCNNSLLNVIPLCQHVKSRAIGLAWVIKAKLVFKVFKLKRMKIYNFCHIGVSS